MKTANRKYDVGAGLLCDDGERSWILKSGMSEKEPKQSKLVVAIVVWRAAAGASLPEAAAPLHG